jgi:hypothetical protein
MAVLVLGAVRFYFVEFTPSRRYGSANGETATMMGHYLRELGQDNHAYLFGAPRLYWSFGTMMFLAPEVRGQDVIEPLDAPPNFVEAGQKAVFLFLPERAKELSWVQQALPGGEAHDVYDSAGRRRFTVYEAPH